jgi:hypothetical protein
MTGTYLPNHENSLKVRKPENQHPYLRLPAVGRKGGWGDLIIDQSRWKIIPSVVNLTHLYNNNEGCHSRESGNPGENTGFRIKSGMTFLLLRRGTTWAK